MVEVVWRLGVFDMGVIPPVAVKLSQPGKPLQGSFEQIVIPYQKRATSQQLLFTVVKSLRVVDRDGGF